LVEETGVPGETYNAARMTEAAGYII
jgi:hypothetical protein